MSNLAPAAVFPSLKARRKSIYVFVLFMALGFAVVDRVAPGGRHLAKVAGVDTVNYSLMPLSHASSFLFGSLFLLSWWKVRDGTKLKGWFLLGMVGGIFSICRWQDVLYLGGPILYDLFNRHPFRDFRGWLRSRAVYATGALMCWIPQIIEWKMIYGKYLTLPQGGGFIKFPPTHVPDILFSTRGSWFLWPPLIIIGIAGLVIPVTRNWRLYVPWVSIVVLELLVIGAMDEWHGRDTFGSRYMLANTPVAALGLALLLASRNQQLRCAFVGISVVCALFTSLFLVQYTMKRIPQNEPLTPTQLFQEKVQIVRVARRKPLVRGDVAALEGGDKAVVLEKLEQAPDLGEDDVALRMAIPLYLAKGDSAKANQAQVRLAAIRAARLP